MHQLVNKDFPERWGKEKRKENEGEGKDPMKYYIYCKTEVQLQTCYNVHLKSECQVTSRKTGNVGS